MALSHWTVVPRRGLAELSHWAIVDALSRYLGEADAAAEWQAACQRCGVRADDERPESLLLVLQVLAEAPGPVGVIALAVKVRLATYGSIDTPPAVPLLQFAGSAL